MGISLIIRSPKLKHMKTYNPKSRFNLSINRKDKVLEVGGGHNPHPRSNEIVDKFIDSNYHRHADLKVLKHQKFLQADGENLPYLDNEFDYVICNHVLEHVENPEVFLKEQMRVSKRGYIEVPSVIGEYLFPKESHKWLILELDNKLVMIDKNKVGFKPNLDFGFLFLTWLQKTSVAYKLFMKTKPNFMTVRYEWKDTIEFEVNPDNPEYLKYFSGCWDKQMVEEFFPEQSMFQELKSVVKELYSLVYEYIKRKGAILNIVGNTIT